MEINNPDTLSEIAAAIAAYEDALVSNDLAALDASFLDRPDTVRYGPGETLYGARAIAAFRAARPNGPRPREVLRVTITTFERDFGVAHVEFRLAGNDNLGRQSQTWVRHDGAWRIASAHVSYTSP